MADGNRGGDSKRLNLIREEPLKKRGEQSSALPFFIDYLVAHMLKLIMETENGHIKRMSVLHESRILSARQYFGSPVSP
jgi:hypothetical protein